MREKEVNRGLYGRKTRQWKGSKGTVTAAGKPLEREPYLDDKEKLADEILTAHGYDTDAATLAEIRKLRDEVPGQVDFAVEIKDQCRRVRDSLAELGDTVEARLILENIEKSPRFVVPLMISHATLGDVDEAFAWLEVARDVRLPWYPWFVTWFPQLETFRDDPRMRAHARALGLEHVIDTVIASNE